MYHLEERGQKLLFCAVSPRCVDANMLEVPVEVESSDHHYYHHAFFTTREVRAMEELTWDYGIDFEDDSHPVKAFQCKCGSKSCRNIKHKRRTNQCTMSERLVCTFEKTERFLIRVGLLHVVSTCKCCLMLHQNLFDFRACLAQVWILI